MAAVEKKAPGEATVDQQLKSLQEKFNAQEEKLKSLMQAYETAAQKNKEYEESVGKQGAFTVADVIDAKKEIIRLQQSNHELHAQINKMNMESGQRKDELDDAKLSVEDLKVQLRDLNIELDVSRPVLSHA